MLSVSDEHSCV